MRVFKWRWLVRYSNTSCLPAYQISSAAPPYPPVAVLKTCVYVHRAAWAGHEVQPHDDTDWSDQPNYQTPRCPCPETSSTLPSRRPGFLITPISPAMDGRDAQRLACNDLREGARQRLISRPMWQSCSIPGTWDGTPVRPGTGGSSNQW